MSGKYINNGTYATSGYALSGVYSGATIGPSGPSGSIGRTGFALGLTGTSATRQQLSASLFSTEANGTFDNAAERFAYNTGTGALYYDAKGNTAGSSPELVATLTGHPTLAATDLFFGS